MIIKSLFYIALNTIALLKLTFMSDDALKTLCFYYFLRLI